MRVAVAAALLVAVSLGAAAVATADTGGLADRSMLEGPGPESAAGAAGADAGRTSSAGRRPKSFLKGFAEPSFNAGDPSERGFWFDQAVRANANIVRLNVPWRSLADGRPASPTDPDDPAYDFSELDRATVDATLRGQRILLTVYDAPDFAEGPNPSSEAPGGTWKPRPKALGKFAEALATRYSGQFSPGVIPRVQYFEAWNEPNLSDYISPQYTKKSTFAGDHYREMVNAFAAGVRRSGNAGAKVVAGAAAPYGDPQGGTRTRPLRFLRDFLCLDSDLNPRHCKQEARFDILSHHPITLSGGPNRSAIHPDDAAMPDVHNIVDTLRAAERRKTVRGGRHPVWATEYWWETDPPDPVQGVSLAKHSRWVQYSFYSLWRQGASAAIWLLLRDVPAGSDGISEQQSGLFFLDRREKPSFTAFRFPFVADRISKKKVNVWTIPPVDGTLEVQAQRGGEFRTIDRMDVTDGKPDQKKIAVSGKTKLRGLLGGETSLSYNVK